MHYNTLHKSIAILLGLFLLAVAVGSIFFADQKKTMTIYTASYKNSSIGTVYTLYDQENDLKITTPGYELAAEPGADKAYLATAITCSISKSLEATPSYLVNEQGKNRPLKIYQGMKATYKSDGAVFLIYLENGDQYSACDVSKWNYSRLGNPGLGEL
jgi:hypothetical protein